MNKITDEIQTRAVELFDEGMTRNAIARELGIAGSTVTRICHEAGRQFDREKATLSLRAAKVDIEEERLLLSKKMMVAAHDMIDALDGPHLVYNFGGKDNDYNEHLLDTAPVETRLSAMRAASLAFDKATRIIERTNTGLDGAVGVLDTLAAGFAAAAQQYRNEEADGADENEAADVDGVQ